MEGIAGCFIPNGRWIATASQHEAIKNYFRQLAEHTSMALHYATNPMIEIDASGTRATATFYLQCLATMEQLDSQETDAVIMIGTYSDTCVKVDGSWFFEELNVDVRHSPNWVEGWVNQPFRDTPA